MIESFGEGVMTAPECGGLFSDSVDRFHPRVTHVVPGLIREAPWGSSVAQKTDVPIEIPQKWDKIYFLAFLVECYQIISMQRAAERQDGFAKR